MQRLTTRNFNMCEDCPQGTSCEHYCDETSPVCSNKAIYDRLADYEDTNMEPEDLRRVFNKAKILELTARFLGVEPDRLWELVEEYRG